MEQIIVLYFTLIVHFLLIINSDAFSEEYACKKRRDYWLLDIPNKICIYPVFKTKSICSCDSEGSVIPSQCSTGHSKYHDNIRCKSECICEESAEEYIGRVDNAVRTNSTVAMQKALKFWALLEWDKSAQSDSNADEIKIELRSMTNDGTNTADLNLRMVLQVMLRVATDSLSKAISLEYFHEHYLGELIIDFPPILDLRISAKSKEAATKGLFDWQNYFGPLTYSAEMKSVLRCNGTWRQSFESTPSYAKCLKAMQMTKYGDESWTTWFNGKARCGRNHTKMAIPSNKRENGLIAQLVETSGAKFGWIGVVKSEDGSWVNAYDDSSLAWTNWEINKSSHDKDNCVMISITGEWRDVSCLFNADIKDLYVICQEIKHRYLDMELSTVLENNDVVGMVELFAYAGLAEPLVNILGNNAEGIKDNAVKIIDTRNDIYSSCNIRIREKIINPKFPSNSFQQLDAETLSIFSRLKCEFNQNLSETMVDAVNSVKIDLLNRFNEFRKTNNYHPITDKTKIEMLRLKWNRYMRFFGVKPVEERRVFTKLLNKDDWSQLNLYDMHFYPAIKCIRKELYLEYINYVLEGWKQQDKNTRIMYNFQIMYLLNKPVFVEDGMEVPIHVSITELVDALRHKKKSTAYTIKTLLSAINEISSEFKVNTSDSLKQLQIDNVENNNNDLTSKRAVVAKPGENTNRVSEPDTDKEPIIFFCGTVFALFLQWTIFAYAIFTLMKKQHEHFEELTGGKDSDQPKLLEERDADNKKTYKKTRDITEKAGKKTAKELYEQEIKAIKSAPSAKSIQAPQTLQFMDNPNSSEISMLSVQPVSSMKSIVVSPTDRGSSSDEDVFLDVN